jgi:hypothetical protein
MYTHVSKCKNDKNIKINGNFEIEDWKTEK